VPEEEEEEGRAEVEELQGHGGNRRVHRGRLQASLAGDIPVKLKLLRMGWFEQLWFLLIMLRFKYEQKGQKEREA
jgi:hypothetical protein